MTVQEHIDQIEAYVREARKWPFIGGVRVDVAELMRLLEGLRGALLEQVTPLDEDRLIRRSAGVWDPMTELFDVLLFIRPGAKAHLDRELLLSFVRRMREGVAREDIVPRPEPAAYDPSGVLDAVARLEQLLDGARPVPLTSFVRIDKEDVYDELDQLRARLPDAVQALDESTKTRLTKLLPLIDELDDRIHEAPPVPLTDQVRVEPSTLSAILERMRAAFLQGTLAALTN